MGNPAAFANGKQMFLPFPKNDVDAGIFDQLSKILYELNTDVLPINPASEGKSEHAGEPAILFNMKMQIIEQAQLVLMRNVENFLEELGEAYINAAKLFYAKDRRVFYKKNGEEIIINDVKLLPSGDIAIDNDMGSIQRCHVVVSLSPKSPNSRFAQRMTQLDLLNLLLKNPQPNVELIASCTAKIIETIEFDDEEEKILAEQIGRVMKWARMQMDKLLMPPQLPTQAVLPQGVPRQTSVQQPVLPRVAPEAQVQKKLSILTAPQGAGMVPLNQKPNQRST